jgi:hypothetical protein
MSEQDPYTQVRQQRAVARAQRAYQGQSTPLDAAEERFEAIAGRVGAMRRGFLFLVALLVGWVGTEPGASLIVSLASVYVGFILGSLFGAIAHAISGAFRQNIKQEVEAFFMIAAGAAGIALGSFGLLGAMLTGAVMIGWSLIWPHWSKRVLTATDFIRLRQAQNHREQAPAIME